MQINRLRQWYRPGLLCIGDAAHAMSPAGGVGINLAIQDAVATANLLADPLREGRVTEWWLAQVQRRREFPTRVTQQVQVFAHNGFQRIFQNPGAGQSAMATEGGGANTRNSARARAGGWHGRSAGAHQGREEAIGLLHQELAVGVGVAMGVAALAVGMVRKQRRRAEA